MSLRYLKCILCRKMISDWDSASMIWIRLDKEPDQDIPNFVHPWDLTNLQNICKVDIWNLHGCYMSAYIPEVLFYVFENNVFLAAVPSPSSSFPSPAYTCLRTKKKGTHTSTASPHGAGSAERLYQVPEKLEHVSLSCIKYRDAIDEPKLYDHLQRMQIMRIILHQWCMFLWVNTLESM